MCSVLLLNLQVQALIFCPQLLPPHLTLVIIHCGAVIRILMQPYSGRLDVTIVMIPCLTHSMRNLWQTQMTHLKEKVTGIEQSEWDTHTVW